MTFGSVILFAVFVAIIAIGVKVRRQSKKIQEIDSFFSNES